MQGLLFFGSSLQFNKSTAPDNAGGNTGKAVTSCTKFAEMSFFGVIGAAHTEVHAWMYVTWLFFGGGGRNLFNQCINFPFVYGNRNWGFFFFSLN